MANSGHPYDAPGIEDDELIDPDDGECKSAPSDSPDCCFSPVPPKTAAIANSR